jgi:F-box and leucine-rich repeat protein GRR1
MLLEPSSESSNSFYEDMINITDRLPTEEEYRRVRHLRLQKTREPISDEELSKVLAGCPHLETVVLTGAPDTTDRSVAMLAAKSVNLLGLNLTGCRQITDVGVLEITNKSLPLQWLQLNGVVGLTDPSISAIAKTCSRLMELEICDLPLLTPVAVMDIWSFSR